MNTQSRVIGRQREAVLATNKLIRNTYILLSLTLAFSALTAGFAMVTNAQPVNFWLMLAVFIGGPFVISAARKSAWSLVLVFAFTGFMGYVLGPILSYYLALPNGNQIVMTALGATALIFLGLSGYALSSRKDFSFMRGFLMVGLLVLIGAIILSFFVSMPGLSLAISAAAVILMSGFILYDTSRMVHGGETNYVMMTVSLYANIYVLFIHLLNLISAFSGND